MRWSSPCASPKMCDLTLPWWPRPLECARCRSVFASTLTASVHVSLQPARHNADASRHNYECGHQGCTDDSRDSPDVRALRLRPGSMTFSEQAYLQTSRYRGCCVWERLLLSWCCYRRHGQKAVARRRTESRPFGKWAHRKPFFAPRARECSCV